MNIVNEFESNILSAEPPEFTKILGEWLPKTGNWSVCWRATRDGNKSEIFHEKCDSKIPTLTVVKVLKDNTSLIFGGYATANWSVAEGSNSPAPGSFLFSFRNNDNLQPFMAPLINSTNKFAIQRHEKNGLQFGVGPDLSILNKEIKLDTTVSAANLGRTYQAPPGYIFEKGSTPSLLAGSLFFIPAEIEVLFLN